MLSNPTQPRGDQQPEPALNPQRFTLMVDGIAETASFNTLTEAVSALASLLATLPLDPAQQDAYRWFLEDAARVQDYLDAEGEYRLEITTAPDGETRAAVIRRR